MKWQISSWAFAFVISLALIAISLPTFALYHSAYYCRNDSSFYLNEKWMEDIDDNTKLSQLSIPGSNASESFGEWGLESRTQIMDVRTLLFRGIRYFDFGCFKENSNDKTLYLYYYWLYLNQDLSRPLTKIKNYLKKYPSETVIVHIRQEYSTHNDTVFYDCISEYIKQYSAYIWHSDDYNKMNFNPSLGEIRGKIVFLLPFYKSEHVVKKWDNPYYMQGSAYFYTNWDLYDKWVASKEFIKKYRTDSIPDRPTILYITAEGNSFPYFVASGHWHFSNNADQLSTGFTTPLFKNYYPDFPRTACFLGMCTISFKGLNMLLADYIANDYNVTSVGIVAANFPGSGFIDPIIALNRFFAKPQFITGVYFKIVPILEPNYAIDYDIKNSIAVLWEFKNKSNQQWKFEHVLNSPYYRISSVHDDTKSLAVSDVDIDSSSVVIQEDKNNYTVSQLWTLERHENGYFSLKSTRGLYLHYTSVKIGNGKSLYVGNPISEGFVGYYFYIHPTIV